MRHISLALLLLIALPALGEQPKIWAPAVIGPWQGGVLLEPDGSTRRFVSKGVDGSYENFSQLSTDSGRTWGPAKFEYMGPPADQPLRDRDGEIHVFPMLARYEGDGKEIAIGMLIDIWHVRTYDGGTRWSAPKMIFKGYVGSLNCVTQLSSGRIIVPFAAWIGGRPEGPPTGANVVTCVYSDDGGMTWQQSPAALTAPCYTDYNGSGYGACEPVVVELRDGRIYMLARTETGRLYESYSSDGVVWEPLRPSRFEGSDAPANFLRLPDGRLMLFYNACEKPPRVNKAGVYGGRDALHAAISDDEGQTWRGFREVYRDPTRNDSPQRTGDRGTAYPLPYLAKEGNVILMGGQGRSGATLLFNPDWLLEEEQREDFSGGLDAWSVFKHFGPAEGWWQDRAPGAMLADHPDKAGAKVLHVRRPDDKPGDGANWNFPMGQAGELTLRVLLRGGNGGMAISLADRFFNPEDPTAESKAVFTLPIEADGSIALAEKLRPDTWHTLHFAWSLPGRICVVSVDGTPKVWLPQQSEMPIGVNYLRLRSMAQAVDNAGLLVESVAVKISGASAAGMSPKGAAGAG